MDQGLLIILTGPTASGKDTTMQRLLQKFPHLQKIVTTTSRKTRTGERDGFDYHFISEEEFRQKIEQGEFIEYVKYGDNFYGTEKQYIESSQGKDTIWRIDPSRAGQIRQLIQKRPVLVIYITISEEEARKRLRLRQLTDIEIEKRLTQDKKDWDQYQDQYDFVVENPQDKLEETITKVSQIIEDHLH